MKTKGILATALIMCGAGAVGQMSVNAQPGEEREGGVAGNSPDVIVGSLPAIKKWGTTSGVTSYSVATTSCNIGNQILKWCDTNNAAMPCLKNEHPVISQNLYRLRDGRFEQVGMSWLKHGFCALSETLCGSCNNDPWGCDALGIGCSDPYSVDNNGSQNSLGPQSQVNPVTGIFPYPFTAPPAGGVLGRRLRVNNTDLDPALNPGALFFAQGDYVQLEDAAAGNNLNNTSYRRVTVGSLVGGGYNLSLTGATFQQKPAILAWKEHGLGVNTPDPDVVLVNVDVPGDGRFIVAYKVTDLGDNTWSYEYAIQNYNSHRSARSFTVAAPACAGIEGIGFHDVDHHSGEPFDNADWRTDASPVNTVRWEPLDETNQPITFETNPNANALRWTTLYNFRFTSATPPVLANATLELFMPGAEGDPATVEVQVLVPSDIARTPDLDDSGIVDGADLGLLLGNFDTADCDSDLDGNGIVDGADLGLLLGAWE